VKQQTFEEKYCDDWKNFTQLLEALQSKEAEEKKVVLREFPMQYRKICHHLSLAKERGYSLYLINDLNG